MWGKRDCIYCEKASNELAKYGYEFTKLTLDSDFVKSDFVNRFPNEKTFPQIVYDSTDEHIGGFDKLQQWIALKELSGMSL